VDIAPIPLSDRLVELTDFVCSDISPLRDIQSEGKRLVQRNCADGVARAEKCTAHFLLQPRRYATGPRKEGSRCLIKTFASSSVVAGRLQKLSPGVPCPTRGPFE
jgi:hypothetical protein